MEPGSFAVMIGWPSVGDVALVAQSDGLRFLCSGVGKSPGPPTDAEAAEIARACAWGLDPTQRPPEGWRLLDFFVD